MEEDAAVYFFKNYKSVTKCSMSRIPNLNTDKVVQFVVQEARAALDRIYVTVSVGQSNQVYMLVVSGVNTTPRCHPVKRTAISAASSNLDLGELGKCPWYRTTD